MYAYDYKELKLVYKKLALFQPILDSYTSIIFDTNLTVIVYGSNEILPLLKHDSYTSV
jgi:hypothetical protein